MRAQLPQRVRRAAQCGARLCAGLVFGAANTNACPPGFSKIGSEAACASAAGALGRKYVATLTYDGYPSGCFALGTSGGGLPRVYFNDHPTGGLGPNFDTKPLCAGKPPLTAVRVCVCARARVCVCVCVRA